MDQQEDLNFTDDIALISIILRQMQMKTDKLDHKTAQRLGLNISKTPECLSHEAEVQEHRANQVPNGDTINETKDFTYLGAVVSTEGSWHKDMDSKLSKATAAFRKLRRISSSEQSNRRATLRQEHTRLFNTLTKPILLHGSETWKTKTTEN